MYRLAAEPAEFTWIADGMATLVQDVVNVDVTAVSEEGEIDRVIHLGIGRVTSGGSRTAATLQM